ncbi:MAG TPA: hypothetical protein PLB59_09690 [Bacteroidales bacterium]|nr:hypothetical protein [Bacteroidales bacterium]HQP16229.1 hypothetical protein [Bacteroidales bacterium]
MMNINPKTELKKGRSALKYVISNKKDRINAFRNPDFGFISLIYGNSGKQINNFKGGFGISHIIAKRDYEDNLECADFYKKHHRYPKRLCSGEFVAYKLIDVVINGKIIKTVESKKTVHMIKDGYEAILSLDMNGTSLTWIITGYKIKKGL